MLPRYEAGQPGGLLENHHDDDNVEYYIDFDSFEPSPVFYRLVAKLVCETDFRIRAGGAPFVFRDRACFQLHRRFYFTLELVRPSTDQHLILITVKKTTSTAADGQLIKELHGKLETIRRRDFRRMFHVRHHEIAGIRTKARGAVAGPCPWTKCLRVRRSM
ncbi:Hypp8570 [Branchiostoma lanceolatum]|uniref:Hypp8570 protein n=1 Tax=Branchiostoma lanceolatum TaxID=7740 RepID=A0A8J9Z8W0_BRALA|nr:Hypp8570 [Branchiostoma lanceolatum]